MVVQYETRGRVAIITLNRPEQRNAVNGELAQGLETRSTGSNPIPNCGSAFSPATARRSARADLGDRRRQFRETVHRQGRVCGYRQARTRQAVDRGHRRQRARWRNGSRALRHDRLLHRDQFRPAGGEAFSHCGRWRTFPAAARHRHGDGAGGDPDRRSAALAAPTNSAWSTRSWPDQVMAEAPSSPNASASTRRWSCRRAAAVRALHDDDAALWTASDKGAGRISGTEDFKGRPARSSRNARRCGRDARASGREQWRSGALGNDTSGGPGMDETARGGLSHALRAD